MKIYERTLFLKDNSNKIYDCFGNSSKMNDLPHLTAIFCSNNKTITIPQRLDYKNFSVLVSEETEKTFFSLSENLLSNMQKIEILLYQVLPQCCMEQKDYNMLCYYLELEERRVDGKISPNEYSKEINKIDPDTIDPIIKMMNVRTMHNFILDELFHAEYRMIDGFNSQLIAMKSFSHEIVMGKELRLIDPYVDNAAFCYQDALKAIYKVLDIFSRWLSYISSYKNLRKKIPSAYFSDISQEIRKIADGPFKQRMEDICSSLKAFVRIRNEITHNESLGRNRHILFAGRGTAEVNNKDLFYSKILLWDYDTTSPKRASESLGFFTQNLDALTETKSFFIKTVKLVVLGLEHFFYKIIDELATMNVEKPLIWYNYFNNDILQALTIDEIKELYYSEYYLFGGTQ